MKKLVVVESPSKIKKLSGFLGSDYEVVSSVGHIRDLPKSSIAVDVENNFEPMYEISQDKGDVVKVLKTKAKEAESVYLATDPDREGEAIAWHVGYVINDENNLEDKGSNDYMEANKIKGNKKKTVKVYRVTFNSITKDSVLEGFEHPRKMDFNLVDSQQARRVLDRLVGYKLSPLLWQKIRYGLSAGRVQSVAVRFIVERENEIKNFPKEPYFEFKGEFSQGKDKLLGTLQKIDNEKIYKKEKFTLFTGDYSASKTIIDTKQKADEIEKDILSKTFKVKSIEEKESKSYPSPPFTTATLQQAASSKLGYSPSRTMQVAQKLYEGGYITYMRTDSVSIVPTAIKEIRKNIKSKYGEKYLSKTEKHYASKKEAKTQEAHEAIRPTEIKVNADILKKKIPPQQLKLYELIWARTMASQMAAAIFNNTKVIIENEDQPAYAFEAKGSVVKFEGFMKVYNNVKKEELMPVLKEGAELKLDKLEVIDNFLTPPPRYNESSLIKELESFGIGRPSTYASIISTIQTRGYVKKDEKVLFPTDNGVVVNSLLTEHFNKIVDVNFTAEVEEDLDLVAEGELEWRKLMKNFYEPFDILVAQKLKEIKKEDVVVLEKTDEKCPECKEGNLIIKLGKYGKFLSCDRYPDCKYAKPINEEGEGESENGINEMELSEEYQKILDSPCPDCGGKLVIKRGRFGQFIACENYPKCKYTKSIENKLKIKCPKCGKTDGGEVVVKKTKKGRTFYGCSRYPTCDYASWTKP